MIKIIIFLLLYVPLESIAADDEEVKVSIAQYREEEMLQSVILLMMVCWNNIHWFFRNWRKGI